MEWMLQVVDEFDDAIGVCRLLVLGVAAEIGALATAAVAGVAIRFAFHTGADTVLMSTAAMLLAVAAVLKIHNSGLQIH